MLLLIAAVLCAGIAAGAVNQSALDAWPTPKYGYTIPGKEVNAPQADQPTCANKVDALSLLHSQGTHISSEVAINEELFFSGASCGTCVIYRDLSKNVNIQFPWSLGIVSQSCAECKGDISLGILRAKKSRAIEWMPALCTANNATLFYVIRQNARSSDAVITIVNSRLPIVKVESLGNNGSWVALEGDSIELGTFAGFKRSELSLKVRLTSVYNTTVEDLIPGDSGGFGSTQFLPAAPVYQIPASSQSLHSTRNLLQVLQQRQTLTTEEQNRLKYSIVPARPPQPALAPAANHALFNSSLMQEFQQCGGITNCPLQDQGGPCEDKQYFACANPASVCVRINAYYWQCRARAAATPAHSADPPAQQAAAVTRESSPAPTATLTAQQAAAVGPAPEPAPDRGGLILDDGVFGRPGCTPTSTEARCLFGRRLMDAGQLLVATIRSGASLPSGPLTTREEGVPLQPPGCKATSTDPRCMFGRRLAGTTSAAVELLESSPVQPSNIIIQAVSRHLAAADAPAPSAASGPAATSAKPVADYGTCGGTGSGCPLPRPQCKDEAYLPCAQGSKCVRLSSYYWQCQHAVTAGVRDPISAGVPSQAPVSPTAAPGKRSGQNRSPSPAPAASVESSLIVTPSFAEPFVVDPTLMIQPAVKAASGEAEEFVRDFGRCGGTAGFCPPGQMCTDAANLQCHPGSECMQFSALYWQCRPKAAGNSISGLASRRLQAEKPEPPTPSKFGPLPGPKINIEPKPVPWGSSANSSNVPDFGMCGGTADDCPLVNKKACTDSQYLDCAFETSRCTRLSAYFWQCRPIGLPSLTNISGGPAIDYAWCGGQGDLCPYNNKTKCTDSAYLDCQLEDSKCTRVDRWYWHCLPQNGPTPAPAPGRKSPRPQRFAEAADFEAPTAAPPAGQPAAVPARKGYGSHVPDFFQCGGRGDACPLTRRDLCVDGQYLDCPPQSHCVRQTQWYWQCLPETAPAPAPAPAPVPRPSTGRRLQAAAVQANAPAPSGTAMGPLPGPQPAAKPSATAGRAPNYAQCGGQGGTCPLANKTFCTDSQYLDCATPGFNCMRQSNWYWQCVPLSKPKPTTPQPSVKAQPPAAQALQANSSVPIWVQCGGRGQSCPLADKSQCADEQYLNCASDSLQCSRQSQWYWQCVPKTAPAPAPEVRQTRTAPAPYGSGRRLQAEAAAAEGPAALKSAPLPAPHPAAKAPSRAPAAGAPAPLKSAPIAAAQPAAGAPAAMNTAPRAARQPAAKAPPSSHVPVWGQCGGAGDTCPLSNRDLCADAQYLDCAPETARCVRLSNWYWQCLPVPTPIPALAPDTAKGRRLQVAAAPAPSKFGARPEQVIAIPPQTVPPETRANSTRVKDYGQCGGKQTCPLATKALCTDSQYLRCASKTSECVRMSSAFWECLPNSFHGSATAPSGVPLPTIQPIRMQAPPPPVSDSGAQGGRRLTEDSQDEDPTIAEEGQVCGGWGAWCQSQYGPVACASNKQVVPCEENTTCILISGDIMQCIRTRT